MPITALYAGLLAILYLALSVRVIGLRRSRAISLGDGGDKHLLRRMRAHGNFAEYAPMVLLLMALAESLRTSVYALHLVGVLLVAGRLLHALALSGPPNMPLRVGGMALTFAALSLAALLCLGQGLQGVLT